MSCASCTCHCGWERPVPPCTFLCLALPFSGWQLMLPSLQNKTVWQENGKLCSSESDPHLLSYSKEIISDRCFLHELNTEYESFTIFPFICRQSCRRRSYRSVPSTAELHHLSVGPIICEYKMEFISDEELKTKDLIEHKSSSEYTTQPEEFCSTVQNFSFITAHT